MEFLEKDLEDIIYEASQTEEGRAFLINRGLNIQRKGKMYRQVHLGPYGVADLVDIWIESVIHNDIRERILHIEIIELKKESIGYDALGQSCRYATAINEIVYREHIDGYFTDFIYHITIIGSGIDVNKNSFVYLYNETDIADVFIYKYKMDGIYFDYVDHRWRKGGANIKKDITDKFVRPTYSDLKRCLSLYDLRGGFLFNKN